ncbi:MAG: DNA adenine methylase, partial [Methanosarcinales archaeon]|nr:DNA adenine methylase [Methanosarcinales archaeon]
MNSNNSIKPFVKWAGGKGQLLTGLRSKYPNELGSEINKYCEPFVGGGAVLFDILSQYELDEVLINDINAELINTYIQIQNNVFELSNELGRL